MGQLLSLIFKLVSFEPREISAVLLGLDNAGKSTMLYKMHLGELVHTIPTIGFNVESVEFKSLRMTIWDVGGQDKIRPLWRHYYRGTSALIFVVDTNDTERIDEARDELAKLLNEQELATVKVLIFANKQDLPNAISGPELASRLKIGGCRQTWYIQPCSAMTGEGIFEGMNWLVDELNSSRA